MQEKLKKYLSQSNFLSKILHSVKGQIKPKADWGAIDSPKKRTNEFGFFAVKIKKAKKANSFNVFWKNLQHTNLLRVLFDL